MTTIHFVRHGQSTWNAEIRIQGSSDPELSELGITQAKTVAEKLPAFDMIYSSDLKRTRQTTAYLLKGDIGNVVFRSSLREMHLGPWEGMLLSDAVESDPVQTDYFRNQPSKFSLDGAETFHELQTRATSEIKQILDDCKNADINILVSSHGAFIKSLLIDYAGRSIDQLWESPQIANCGHSIVKYTNGQPQMLKFADQDEW